MRTTGWLAVAASAVLAACSADAPPCNADTNLGCAAALQCETVQGRTEPTCLTPVLVRGTIFDLSTHQTVAGARVILVGTDGAPVAAAATSAGDGSYEVRLHAPRDASFMPLSQRLSFWATAPGFGTFPDRWRPTTTVDITTAQTDALKDALVVGSPGTDVFLLPFGGGGGIDVLSGTVPVPTPPAPVLVVAAASSGVGGPVGVSTLADSTGAYTLFSLPPAQYTIRAYTKGANVGDVPIALSAGADRVLDLARDLTPTSTLSGRLQIVGGGTPPTVALFIAATYNEDSGQGDVVPGLTTTAAGDGRFSISGVPSGSYAVVPSADNDGEALVGPPVFIDVVAGQDATVPTNMVVAPAITILGPGATVPEALTAAPTLTWQDIGTEESYHVTVTSGVGVVVWSRDVPKGTTNPAIPYGGPFAPGNFYRFRVQALNAQGLPIAASEDLKGIFYQPGP
jgi:hypothetical protein